MPTFLILFLSCLPAYAGDNEGNVSKMVHSLDLETGPIIGYGIGCIYDCNYQAVELIWQLAWNLKYISDPLSRHKGKLSLIAEIDFNPLISPRKIVELGFGFGLKYSYPVTQIVSPYGFVELGTHYLSGKILQGRGGQAEGFLFEESAGVGLGFNIDKRMSVTIECRFQHLSSAGITNPNRGINIVVPAIGFIVLFADILKSDKK